MSLPNPGMDFTALDPLTAAEMDDIVENIEALADGSGLDDGAIGNTKLSDSAILLGFVNATSNFGTANTASATQISTLTETVTIPAGGRSVEITATFSTVSNATSSVRGTVIEIRANGTAICGSVNRGIGIGTHLSVIHTPSAGSVTYTATYTKETASDATTFGASATNPMQLSIKLV